MCIGREQHVRIGIDEHSNGENTDPKQNLRRSLMLAVEDLNVCRISIRRIDPRKRHVKLGEPLVELFDELFQVLPNGTWIDVVVVVQILDWQIDKC